MRQLRHLPPFNPIALKLLEVSSESDTAIDDFHRVFQSDPALASELLQAANSAEFGFRTRIADIRHALTMLGIERTRSLVFTVALHLLAPRNAGNQDIHQCWSHSFATAVIAEELGVLCQSSPPSVRYTAGLLHDIGRLGLLLAIGPRYSDALSIRYRDLTRANEIEMELFGITHCEAGAQLAQEWGLPDALRLCARHHHSETTTDVGELLHITQLACRLASAIGFKEMAGVGAEQLNDVCLPENIRRRSEFAEDWLRELVAERTRAIWV